MVTMTTRSKTNDDYLPLVKAFPLVPIKNDRHLSEAISVIDRLAVADEEKMSAGEADYLMVLTDLVEKYENEHHAIDLSHLGATDVLKHLLSESDMRASDLGRLLGNRPLGAAILRGERQLSKRHIAVLCRRFGVSADLFLREKRHDP